MANLFDVQGFGALSEWNGQFSSASALAAYQTIASLGSNSIELAARLWTQGATSNTVIADPAKTEADSSLLASFKAAEADGLSVVFKPEITGLDGTASYKLAPSDVASFFASYKAEIVHLATIAQEGGVASFAIGNEMGSLTGEQYRSYWTNIIEAVRQVYHGDITYAAATDEASTVSFWDEVDTIGVNTYPPLTSSETPTVEDLINAWNKVPRDPYWAAALDNKSPVDFLHSLSEQYDKPLLMTEVGYRSVDGTAISPGSSSAGTADNTAQADAYSAFFQVWAAYGGSWLKGVELWQWDLSGQSNPTGYSVMGKPAQSLVSQYFNGQGAVPGLNITAAPIAGSIDVGDGNNVIHANLGDKVIHVGDGDNVIYAGPSTLAPLTTTTITLTGWGSVVEGVGAQAEILVNGQVVSGVLQFQPATDPSGYQTYTVTFNNSTFGTINSVDINLLNSAPGRALHVKDVLINGVALAPGDATNASAPGTFDLYVRTIHFDTSGHQDWFVGDATANDTVYGGAGNDLIHVGAGNDTIDGGGGTNMAVFQDKLSNYIITSDSNGLVITDIVPGHGGVDHLSNIEYLEFADAIIDVNDLAAEQAARAARDSIQRFAAATGSTTETVRHADGSRDIYMSGIAGQSYVAEHDTITSSGTTTLIQRFFANNELAFQQIVNSDRSVSSDTFDSSGHLLQYATRHADGSYDQFNFNTSGALSNETSRSSDGTTTIDTYGIVGKAYTSQHLVNDASGHSVLIEQYRGDGSLFAKQTVDTSGVTTQDQFDSSGHLTQQTITQINGTYVQSNFATDGSLLSQTARNLDGSRTVDTYGIAGQSYSARHDVINASGHTVATTFDNNDGSHTETAYAAGVTLTAASGNNVMNSAGGDNFVFAPSASGHNVVNNFHAGDAAGHDVLEISSTVAADFAHLSAQIVGHDTVIDLGHGASVTLAGVTTALTVHDVLIV